MPFWQLPLFATAALISSAAVATSAPPGAPVFVTLGTAGGPVLNPRRSQPANAVITDQGVILMDAGDGVAERLAAAGIALAQVRAVFISHLHLDHTAGLAGVIGLRWMNDLPGPFKIYGPPGTRAVVDGILQSMRPAQSAGFGLDNGFGKYPLKVEVVELRSEEAITVLPGTQLTYVENSHYSFSPASASAKRSKSFSFRLESGGKSYVYTGDTGPSEAVTRLARNADILVSEVQDLDVLTAVIRKQAPGMPPDVFNNLAEHLRKHHLSPGDVGRMAKAAGVGRVVLTHLGPAPTAKEATDLFVPGVKAVYDGPVVVAEDLDRF